MPRRIDIAMTPGEALLLPPGDCYLVIDALRATTTIATLFDRGLGRLTVVSRLEAGRALKKPGVLLFGEEGGLRPDGFDYGNSPVEAAGLEVTGCEAALVTSNGTVALCAVASRGITAAVALANLSAVSALAANHDSVVIVCAGNGGATRFSLEDFAVACALVQKLAASGEVELGDAAALAREVAEPARFLRSSSHAGILRSLGLADDIEFAARLDSSRAVPVVTSFGDGWAVLENEAGAA